MITRHKVVLSTAIFAFCIFMLTCFMSLKAYNSSRKTEKKVTASVQDLRQQMLQLESRIKDFEKLINDRQTTPMVSNEKRVPTTSVDKMSKYDQQKMVKPVPGSTKKIHLDDIAEIDPDVILELHDERVRKNEIEAELDYLRGISSQQRQADKNMYSEEANELYRKTLPGRFGNNSTEEERLNALNELLDKYPDSYAAAKAVSLKAIESIRRNNIGKAEEYYNMLLDVQAKKTDRVVLDNGFDAVPAVEQTLAYAYYRSGRIEDVKKMVKSLEENYPDSVYRVMSRGGPRIMTSEEAIERIYRVTGIGKVTER